MSEERNRILKMLEEGKITADQAARLIEALGGPRSSQEDEVIRIGRHGAHRHFFTHVRPPRPPRVPRIRAAQLDAIPDIVASAVSSAMQSGFGPHAKVKTDFPDKRSLFIKCVSGDVAVRGWDKDRIALTETGDMTRVRERDDQVMVRSISGDVESMVPREVRVELTSVSGDVVAGGFHGQLGLKSVSGDVEIEDVSGELKVDVVSGDLKMVRVGGRLQVESKSGDIEFVPAGPFEGEIMSKSSDIELVLGPDADLVLDMHCEEEGEIGLKTDIPHEVLDQGEQSMRVKFGEGSREMKIRTRKADITVRAAKE